MIAAAVAAATMFGSAPSAVALDPVDSSRLRNAVTVNGILGHMRALQNIANLTGGTRASGTPGYEASVNYVRRRLQAAGYSPRIQGFDFPFFQELGDPTMARVSPSPRTYTLDDFGVTQYSGAGEAQAPLQAVDLVLPPGPTASTSNSGCEESDFAGFTPGNIALIQRGTCTFQLKAANAQEAGASGVIIFNEGQPGRTASLSGVTLGSPEFTIPVLGTSFEVGNELAGLLQQGSVVMSISADVLSETRKTWNIWADTARGRDDQLVVVGGHLDSVLEGPGINDNGSGIATILETAEEMSELGINPRRKIRFAFWGGEESGLLGSEYYVSRLSMFESNELQNHYANLNFDMLGSPNYKRMVYDGDGSDSDPAGPPGSAQIEDVLNEHFENEELAYESTEFSGRSDYGPFIAIGVPAGGLFSGAEELKTPEEVAIYGGIAGEQLDPCYHEACDTINNVSTAALFELGDAAVHSILTLATSRSGLYEDERRARARRAKRAAAALQSWKFDYKGSHLIR